MSLEIVLASNLALKSDKIQVFWVSGCNFEENGKMSKEPIVRWTGLIFNPLISMSKFLEEKSFRKNDLPSSVS